MATVRNYLSLIRFSHTVFAMPFALIGFSLGVSQWAFSVIPGFHLVMYPWTDIVYLLILVILCMVLARSAAMAFNRYLDRHFDAKNPRTAIREIPAGIISANQTLLFT